MLYFSDVKYNYLLQIIKYNLYNLWERSFSDVWVEVSLIYQEIRGVHNHHTPPPTKFFKQPFLMFFLTLNTIFDVATAKRIPCPKTLFEAKISIFDNFQVKIKKRDFDKIQSYTTHYVTVKRFVVRSPFFSFFLLIKKTIRNFLKVS